jgi:transcription elongation factor SPT4
MPPRKGTATVSKAPSIYIDADDAGFSPASTHGGGDEDFESSPTARKTPRNPRGEENVDPASARELQKRSNKPARPQPQPRQARGTVEQSAAHRARTSNPPTTTRTPPTHATPIPAGKHPKPTYTTTQPATMVQGGAHIPPNQQRNMRACMVCSIVRTQQQFMTQGCPNCEDVLELVGNADQINDCTSQVFEGLISVADTSRSWVARYQRLEGYVPGVYATQVEGILPEDVLAAVETAGINYVPRDGSEQEMLGKD